MRAEVGWVRCGCVVVPVGFGRWGEIETAAVIAKPARVAVADFGSGRTGTACWWATATYTIQTAVFVGLAGLGQPENRQSGGKKVGEIHPLCDWSCGVAHGSIARPVLFPLYSPTGSKGRPIALPSG
jgi:hypothetical protein